MLGLTTMPATRSRRPTAGRRTVPRSSRRRKARGRPARSRGRSRLAKIAGWLAGQLLQTLNHPITLGLLLALYGLATHYVTAMRSYAPMRIDGLLDVKSQLGNVFYAAGKNGWEFFPHLFHGEFGAAVTNLTNISGIRSDVYTHVMHAGATNNAEAYVRYAPFLLGGLVLSRVLVYAVRNRHRAQRLAALALLPRHRGRTAAARQIHRDALGHELRFAQFSFDQILIYTARAGLASAVFIALLLNSVNYYQAVSGLTGYIGYLGSALSTALDYVSAAGVAIFKQLSWHLFFMLTDGKEKTLGLLADSRSLEYVSHYLANFPASRVPAALHTAVYQASCAGVLWAIAHYFQGRLARRFVSRYETLPPHMKRYLAKRNP